jgi:hypothetical protein
VEHDGDNGIDNDSRCSDKPTSSFRYHLNARYRFADAPELALR